MSEHDRTASAASPGPGVPPDAAPPPARAPARPLAPPTFARLVLTLLGLVWICIGLWGLANPVGMAGLVDFELRSNLARLEIRAMYGSFCVAVGALHILAMTRAQWLAPGLGAAAVMLVGLLTGRVLSFAVDGFAGVFALMLIGAEAVAAALAAFALWRLVRAP